MSLTPLYPRFLVVFSSPGTRVPPDIQAILLQSSIPFTLLLSVFILKKRYKPLQIVGGVVVMGGIFLSMSRLYPPSIYVPR